MPPPLDLQNLNPANFGNIAAGLGNLIKERGFNQQVMNAVMANAKNLLDFLKEPDVCAVLVSAGAAGLGSFINERGLDQQAMNALMTYAKTLLHFLKKPNVRAVLVSAGVSFTAVFMLTAGFGFNIVGIGAGTLAAAFQSAFYTPAGGLFATLQSMGMLGTLLPVQVGVAGVSAAVVSAIVWALDVGR